MTDLLWSIRLFGAFRRFGTSVAITAPALASVADLKTRIAEALAPRDPAVAGLVAHSALATDTLVLRDDETVEAGASLAILPPVSGG